MYVSPIYIYISPIYIYIYIYISPNDVLICGIKIFDYTNAN